MSGDLDVAADDFGFIVGAFALVGAIFSIRFHLPQARLVALKKALARTRSELQKAVECGMLSEADYYHERLQKLEVEAVGLNEQAPPTSSLIKEYKRFFRGLSFAIWICTVHTRTMRREILAEVIKGQMHLSGIELPTLRPPLSAATQIKPPTRQAISLPQPPPRVLVRS